jgi:NADPH:quinone reductase-like Zn-dependent oxidoreductase
MRAVEFSMFGDPNEVLETISLPRPEPGPGQALVRMTARTINPADLYMVRGHYGYLPPLPAIPGVEGCGVIDGLGTGVSGYHIGQRVIPITVAGAGSWSEYVVVRAQPTSLIATPDRLDDDRAAQFVVNPLTAWLLVRQRLALGAGDWMVQTAAASRVGRMVTRIATALGVQTINIVHRAERARQLRDQGAPNVLCSATDDVYEQIVKMTGGLGLAGALDAVGGPAAADMARALRPRGRLVVYGLLAGKSTTFDMSAMLFGAATIEGFWLPAVLRDEPAVFAQAAAELIAHPQLPGLIEAAEAGYDLAEVGRAVHHAELPGRHGKVLLLS